MLSNSIPIGTVSMFSFSSADTQLPIGYVLCNGAEVPKIGKFNMLYNVIGNEFGINSPPKDLNNFKIPSYNLSIGFPGIKTIIKYANVVDLRPVVSETYTYQYFGVF